MRLFVKTRFKQQRCRGAALLLGYLLFGIVTGSSAAPKGTTHTVVIDGMQFSPENLEIHVGDTVIWRNKDPFPHTATSDKDGFHSPSIAPGHAWKFVAAKRGTFPYFCALHETMKGSLVVK
jgi:plastocyanin